MIISQNLASTATEKQIISEQKQQSQQNTNLSQNNQQNSVVASSTNITTEYQQQIVEAITQKSEVYGEQELKEDHFCSGFVTAVFVCERRLFAIPFQTCIVSHSCFVAETTRHRAYLLEYCENEPIMVHDVTDLWSFKPTSIWQAFGYNWTRDKYGVKVPIVSYNVQYLAKLFDASAQSRFGKKYVLSGNNCHVVQEQVRYTLRLATVPELHYSSYITRMNCGFNAEKDFKPFWVI